MDRVSVSEAEGRGFDSRRARHLGQHKEARSWKTTTTRPEPASDQGGIHSDSAILDSSGRTYGCSVIAALQEILICSMFAQTLETVIAANKQSGPVPSPAFFMELMKEFH